MVWDPDQIWAQWDMKAVLEQATGIAAPYGLLVEYFPGILSVGVGGDCRTYTPVLCLIGEYPGDEILAAVSTKIGNVTGINRITYQYQFSLPNGSD